MRHTYSYLSVIMGTLLCFSAACGQTPAPSSTSTPQSSAGAPQPVVGAPAPNFTMPDQDGKSHNLTDDRGKIVILAFYPADMTPGCTLEAHSLTAAQKDLKPLGVVTYGVSVQDPTSHKTFCGKEGITYSLLADTDKSVSKNYGVLMPNGNYASRVTFILGRDGNVVYVDKDVNSHVTTCGQDWLTWLNQHHEVVGVSGSKPNGS